MQHAAPRSIEPTALFNGRTRAGLLALAMVSWMMLCGRAHAGGIEYVAPGTVALGRAGAFAARSDDPMALGYNPAALADLADTQVMLNLHNAFYRSCVTRTGSYGDQVQQVSAQTDDFGDIADYGDTPFPEVCNDNVVNPGAWLAFAMRATDELGIGFGVLTPAAAGHLVYGDGTGATSEGDLPSPLRYMMVEQQAIVVHPTIGFGYRILDSLSVGLSFQSGIAVIKATNMTLLNGSENAAEDTRSNLDVKDLFVPALIGSVHLTVHDNLELTAFGRWSDDIRASGAVDVDVKAFNDSVAKSGNDDVTVDAPQPDHFGIAARFADRRTPRVGVAHADPLRDERWDLELDAVYILASQMDVIAVDIPTLPMLIEDGLQFDLPHHWVDQLSLRVGGDFNVIPERLAVRAGVHYETSAIDGSYMGVDFQPAQRLGLHAGLTYRLGVVDLSFAYAHIFQETVVVPVGSQAYRQVAKNDPVLVNAGTYTSGYDVLSLGANFHLGS